MRGGSQPRKGTMARAVGRDGAGTQGVRAARGSPAGCEWHRDTCLRRVLQGFIPRDEIRITKSC